MLRRLFSGGATYPQKPQCADPVPENAFVKHAFVACVVLSAAGSVWVAERLAEAGDAKISGDAGACAAFGVGGVRDYLLGAVPFFLLMLVVEKLLLTLGGVRSSAGHFTAVDTWCSVAMGLTQLMWLEVFLRVFRVRDLYCGIYARYRFVELPTDWRGYAIAFVVDDFQYYWFHRLSHQIGILWAAHVAHHSAERYNLSTALRQSYMQSLYGPLFRLLTAPLVHPRLNFTASQFMINYQFWIHTTAVRRIDVPGFELVMNTPSHHRVHHDRRVHKNFGGVFIIWDRIFGTFRSEFDCDVDGVDADASSSSSSPASSARGTKAAPLPDDELVLFGVYDSVRTWTEAVTQTQWLQDYGLPRPLSLWFGPGYFTASRPRRLPAVAAQPRFRQDDRPRGALTNAYLGVYLAWSVLCGLWVLKRSPALGLGAGAQAAVTAFVSSGMIAQGLVCDRAYAAALTLEAARFIVALGTAPMLPPYSALAAVVAMLWCATIWGRH